MQWLDFKFVDAVITMITLHRRKKVDFHDELLLNTKDGFDENNPQIPHKRHWSFFISPNTKWLFRTHFIVVQVMLVKFQKNKDVRVPSLSRYEHFRFKNITYTLPSSNLMNQS